MERVFGVTVWCSVSDAQCGTSDPPHVVAIPHPCRDMGVTIQGGSSGASGTVCTRSGPDIYTPSAWLRPSIAARPPSTSLQVVGQALPPMPGYAQHHALYCGQQDHWMNQAYQSPPSETITLEISALHEGGPHKGRMHGTPFGNICEGMKDIDAHATTPKLASIALNMITPKISTFC
ncbi:hypothetical protein EDC04DRAFT_2909070 [Pisolithus marmoratus]|nr:hypothetical protein EDC04DRAFT_2909070 [Pisolithus marmoratus]